MSDLEKFPASYHVQEKKPLCLLATMILKDFQKLRKSQIYCFLTTEELIEYRYNAGLFKQ